jgi:hypothetical protein
VIRLIVPLVAFAAFAPLFPSNAGDEGQAKSATPEAQQSLPAPARANTPGGAGAAGFQNDSLRGLAAERGAKDGKGSVPRHASGESQAHFGGGFFQPPPFNPLAPPVDQHIHDIGEMKEGGDTSPSGVEIQCDLPAALRKQNVGGRDGAGLCVFTSIMHASRYQNEKRLWNFQADMQKELGGGYPDKVDKMIAKYGPGTKYIQHEGGDLDFLYQALMTGRMVSVTYDGRDPRYGRQRIAHMVNLVHLDPPEKSPRYAGILDNNFTKEVLWMTVEEFKSRWLGNSGGWAVVLLAPRPPLAPRN